MSNPLPSPVRPLNVGNVVSAGLVLYRSNLKQYFLIAIKANLWFLPAVFAALALYFSFLSLLFRSFSSILSANGSLPPSLGPLFQIVGRFSAIAPLLIPILLFIVLYCNAKYLANSALISRLAYQEMANQPESASDAGKKVYPRMWTFFLAGLEVGLRLFGLYFLFSFAGGIVAGVLSVGSRSPLNQSPIFIVIIIAAILGLVWYYTRWSISEVPLAVETELSSSQGVQRSWDLTATAVGRVQLIVFVAFLVTIPIQAITNYLPSYFLRLIPANSFAFWIVYIVNILISLLGGVIVLPFWQSIKAVMYYDLRSRREGIDLQLRDR